MTLQDILRVKGAEVHTIGPRATLEEVVNLLVEKNCGSLVVCDEDDPALPVGIITERDILRACAANRSPLPATLVSDVMSAHLLTGTLDDSVADTMGVMTENRIRHLPILEDGKLVGLISIGDVVKSQHAELTAENHLLKEYIQS